MSPWPEVMLGDVASIQRRIIEPRDIREGTLYVGLENVDGGTFTGVGNVGPMDLASAKFMFTPDHVLFGKLRPYLAKIARPWFEGVCSTDILPIAPGAQLDRNYLAHYLAQPAVIARAAQRATGMNLPRLSPKELERFKLPLPPLDEQRRVARVLDAADALRAKRRETLMYAGTLVTSIYSEMFHPSHGSPGRWPRVPLREVARVVRGASPRPAGDPRYFGGSIPWLKISDVTAARGRQVDDIKGSVTEAGAAKSVRLEAGTLILTNSATVGIPKFLGIESCIHDGFLAFLDLDEEALDPVFLWGTLEARRDHLLRLAPEGTQKNLNTGIVKSFQIDLPPLTLQADFAGVVRRLEHEDRSRIAHLTLLEELFPSLQARAFAGEL